MDRGSWSRHIRGRPSNRQPPNADFPTSLPPLGRSRGRKIRPQSAVKERLPITCRCYTILGPAKTRPRTLSTKLRAAPNAIPKLSQLKFNSRTHD
jgi:hypothetical protein